MSRRTSGRGTGPDATGTSSGHGPSGVSPGKRARTEALPMRKQAADPVSSPSLHVTSAPVPTEDPFGVHLRATARDGVSGAGGALPHAEQVQASFGHHDIRHVRAHVGGPAADAASVMRAHAYATGSDIAFAETPSLELAAHEAAHVVQQQAGVSLKSHLDEAGDSHERQADEVAAAVVRGDSAEPLLDQIVGASPGGDVVQRKRADEPDDESPADDLVDAAHATTSRALAASGGTGAELRARSLQVPSIMDRVVVLAGLVETSEKPLRPAEIHALEGAVNALSRLLVVVDPDSAGDLGAVIARLRAGARARGATLGVRAAASSSGGDSFDELGVVERAIGARIEQIEQAAGGRSGAGRNGPFLEGATDLAAMLRVATSLVGLDAAARPEALTGSLGRIGDHMMDLWVAARRTRVDQAAAGLDQVFLAEDAMCAAAGVPPPGRREAFYADRTAGDVRGDTQERLQGQPVAHKTGAGLIGSIQDWFRMEPLVHLAGLTSVAAIVQEPPRVNEPSTLEKVIAAAASTFVGMLPGYITGIVGQAVMAWAQSTPGTPAGSGGVDAPRAVGFPMNTDSGYVASHNDDGDGAGAKGAPNVSPDGQQVLSAIGAVLDSAAQAAAAVGTDGVAAHQGSDGALAGPQGQLSTAFITDLTERLTSYSLGVAQNLGAIASALAIVPPAELEQMRDELWAKTSMMAGKIRADLVAQWATVVTAATNGVDANGNNAHHGTLEQVKDMPGTIQIAVVVRKTHTRVPGPGLTMQRVPGAVPEVEVMSVSIEGMSESALFELRRANRPLSTVGMHRSLAVSVEDAATSAAIPIGRIDFGPDGQVGLDRVRWVELAMLAQGDIPDERTGDATEDILHRASGASQPRAEAGARLLLGYVHKTTKDIQ